MFGKFKIVSGCNCPSLLADLDLDTANSKKSSCRPLLKASAVTDLWAAISIVTVEWVLPAKADRSMA